MTQFGTTDSAAHLNRILPLPIIPSYIGRHPIYPKASPEIATRIYNPLYPTKWQKSSDNYAGKSRDYHCATYTYIGPEWFKAPPKHYATYKEPLHRPGTAANGPNAQDALNRVRPHTVPNHTTRTSQEWSRFLDEYPGRFKIEYPSPDDVNDMCFRNNHVQYDVGVTHRPGRYAFQSDKEPLTLIMGLPGRIEPVTNPYRVSEAKHTNHTTRQSWVPYGNAPCRYQNTVSQNPRF